MGHYGGGSWIRPVKRLAIYMRDEWRCAYCQTDVREPPTSATLEHLYGRELRGPDGELLRGEDYNRPSNLVLACWECNHDRGRMPLHVWLADLSEQGRDVDAIVNDLYRRTDLPLDMDAARTLDDDPPGWLIQVRVRVRIRFRDEVAMAEQDDEAAAASASQAPLTAYEPPPF